MKTRAFMVARSKRFVWISLPDIAEHQTLTIDRKEQDFDHAPGDTFTVYITGDIVGRPSPFSGWTADISERTS